LSLAIGRYDLTDELGRGGEGRVYRARNRETGAVSAVKVIDAAGDPTAIARFRREIEAVSRVGPEGIVPILEAGTDRGHLFFAMELMPGGSLHDRRSRQRTLPWPEAATIVAALARTLDRCHEAGLVHRDLKPANVLFDAAGRARLADFGCVRDLLNHALTRSGDAMGTPAYMAPEHLAGKKVDNRADIFSLGVILYELVTGNRPFLGTSWLALMNSIQSGTLPAPDPKIPACLDGVFVRTLAADPAKRYATADDLADALEAALATVAPGAAPGPVEPFPGRRVRVALAVSLVLAVSFLGLALVLGRRPPKPPPPPAPLWPAWFDALAAAERPAFPLPAGLAFGDRARDYVNTRDGSVLVYVPPGSFRMGCDAGEPNEAPAHDVTLPGYFLGKYEVTNALFDRFVHETGWMTTAEAYGSGFVYQDHVPIMRPERAATWRDPAGDGRAAPADHPVCQVSWLDALAYVEWAGLTLPTEAQWEKAASWDPATGKTTPLPWGDAVPGAGSPAFADLADESLRAVWSGYPSFPGYSDGFERTAPVGSFPRGASPTGALDMVGNVNEWCRDGYAPYGRGPERDPHPAADGRPQRVFRGGSWSSSSGYTRVTFRFNVHPGLSSDVVGLRVAREVP
jgi:serine/threonine-protein kinase